MPTLPRLSRALRRLGTRVGLGAAVVAGAGGALALQSAPPLAPLAECHALSQEVHEVRLDWAVATERAREARACFAGRRDSAAMMVDIHDMFALIRLGQYGATRALHAKLAAEHLHDDNQRLSVVLVGMDLLVVKGDIVEALEAGSRGFVAYPEARPPRRVSLLRLLGHTARRLHDHTAARRYYAQAEALAAAHEADFPYLTLARLLTEHERVGLTLRDAQNGRGDVPLAEAIERYEGVYARLAPPERTIFERTQGALWLSEAYRHLGDPARALAFARQAEPLAREQEHYLPTFVSWVLAAQGLAYADLGDLERARALVQQAVRRDEARGDYNFLVSSLRDLAHVELAAAERAAGETAGTPDFALTESLLRRATEMAEIERTRYALSEWTLTQFADRQDPYRDLVRLLAHQRRAAEALDILDRTRGRHLRDLRITQTLRAGLDDDDRARLDSLGETLKQARFGLLTAPAGSADAMAAQGEVTRAERLIEDLSGFASTPPQPLDLPALQAKLGERNSALLSYFLDEEASYVFVATPDTVAALPLELTPGAVDSLVLRAIPLIARPALDALPDLDPVALHALYEALIAPAEPLLPEGAGLVVIPEGGLTALPFAILLTAPGDRHAYGALPYLLRERPVTMEVAAALLLEPPPPPQGRYDLLAFGRSLFEGDTLADEAALADLPSVPDELRRVGRRVASRQVALNEDATEARFLERAPDARVLHVATHARTNPDAPFYSYVVLNDDPEHGDDGRLHLYELRDHALPAQLVVLSGCGTARGERRLGEGMIGMQFAFRASGAASLVATLWQVDDRAMAHLMGRFYAHLRAGLPKDRALQRAQLDYLDAHEGPEASPYLWASAVLYGDSAPVIWGSSWPRRLVGGGLLAALTAAALVLSRRRARA